ncbi:MAG: hypothetical protein NXI04_00475 [Planctomycetaceae bacterium]|nr:hypothetical protein [Planctomycetaceae bacterium]
MPDSDRDMFPETSLYPLYEEVSEGAGSSRHSVYTDTTTRLDRLERGLAAFFGTLLSILFVFLMYVLCTHRVFGDPGPPLLIVSVLVVIAELPFLYRLWSCARQPTPIGPAVAARTTPLQFPLRLIVIFWWLLHVLAGLGAVITAEMRAVQQGFNNPGFLTVMSGIMMFGMSVCCNVFIAMSIKEVSGKDALVERFWRYRLVVDGLITVSAISLA